MTTAEVSLQLEDAAIVGKNHNIVRSRRQGRAIQPFRSLLQGLDRV